MIRKFADRACPCPSKPLENAGIARKKSRKTTRNGIQEKKCGLESLLVSTDQEYAFQCKIVTPNTMEMHTFLTIHQTHALVFGFPNAVSNYTLRFNPHLDTGSLSQSSTENSITTHRSLHSSICQTLMASSTPLPT